MPWAAGRACAEPGCPAVARGASRCPPHQRAYEAAADSRRPSASRRGYGAAWGRVRRAFLAVHPRCVQCGAPATDADHIVAKRDGGSDDWANLRPFCHSCHSARTGRDQGGFRRR